jgi:succinate-acetate transporter protein
VLAERVLTSTEHGRTYFYPETASGTPLALIGFGFGLTVVSIIQTHWLPLTTIGFVIPVAFGFSALCTIVGGLWEFRGDNLFGGLWPLVYGGFWLSLGLILNTYAARVTSAAGALAFGRIFGSYLLILGFVTVFLMVAAYFVAAPALLAFVLLVAVDILLGLAYILPNSGVQMAGGYLGLVDSLIAWYVAAALLINTTAGRNLLPIWPYPYRRAEARTS